MILTHHKQTTKILATADSFSNIEGQIEAYFHKQKKIILRRPGQWEICLPDGTPFGAVHSYHIIQTGARYKFVCLLLIVADRWFASSKICSACGYKLDILPLSVRQWTCPICSTAHDRDVNAAQNLKNLAVSSTVLACGEEGAGLVRKIQVKPASMKQEVNSKSV